MLVTVYNKIRGLQRELFAKLDFTKDKSPVLGSATPAEHKPEMLLIGCIDARLNVSDVGIPDGKALIYRNIAALVPEKGKGADTGVPAALEFAVDKMHVKRIVVMGHTHCGGIDACLSGDHEHTQHIRHHLEPLEKVRAEAVAKGESIPEQARDMEKAAVVQSLDHLMTYDVVRKAVEAGTLTIEGWVIDTGTKLIFEYNPKTKDFVPMGSPMQHQQRTGGQTR